MSDTIVAVAIFVGIIVVLILASAIKVLREYERGVVFRLGRIQPVKGPGLFLIIPIIDKILIVDLRVIVMDVPSQEVITKDNVPAKVNAVVYFKVLDPEKAVVQVTNHILATSQIAQTTLRSTVGAHELDDLLSERDKINRQLQQVIDTQTDPWGVKVTVVEVKEVELPDGMKRAMARQAEAERERRAKVINAEGEYQAATRLADAADIIGKHPSALLLRFLQTVTEVASEKSSTTILPVPIDLFRPFWEAAKIAGKMGAESG